MTAATRVYHLIYQTCTGTCTHSVSCHWGSAGGGGAAAGSISELILLMGTAPSISLWPFAWPATRSWKERKGMYSYVPYTRQWQNPTREKKTFLKQKADSEGRASRKQRDLNILYKIYLSRTSDTAPLRGPLHETTLPGYGTDGGLLRHSFGRGLLLQPPAMCASASPSADGQGGGRGSSCGKPPVCSGITMTWHSEPLAHTHLCSSHTACCASFKQTVSIWLPEAVALKAAGMAFLLLSNASLFSLILA